MKEKISVKKIIKSLIIYIVIFLVALNMFTRSVYAEDDVLAQIKDTLKKYYIGEIPESVLNATTIEEIINFLGDPYAQYYTKGEFDEFIDELDMKFTGIGVTLEKIEKGMEVISVFANSPAKEEGIKAGDIITEVDGLNIAGLPYIEAIPLINGEEGVMLNLKIRRYEKEIIISLIPRKIPYPTVLGKILEGNIGYIRISSFSSETGDEFGEKLKELNERHAESYIIDLRNNHGGYLYPVLDIAGYFIGNNTSFILEDNVDGRFSLKAYNHGDIIRSPVIFLSNEITASAAEFLLVAMRDYNRGFIVGENTYGKGVAQGMFKLKDGSVLKTSTLKFYSPTGKEINSTGITPDLKVNLVDPLYAAELLLGRSRSISEGDFYTRVKLYNSTFDINISRILDKNYWEAYRTILGKTSYYLMLNNRDMISKIKGGTGIIPHVNFVEVPKVQYKLGERINFKMSAPEYASRLQYRAELWDEESNTYNKLWYTEDGYYTHWQPKGSDVFTIGFPAVRPGNYRIRIYAKRAGVLAGKTMYKEMGCDCYIGEIPFIVTPS